jgi:hypothetical protein
MRSLLRNADSSMWLGRLPGPPFDDINDPRRDPITRLQLSVQHIVLRNKGRRTRLGAMVRTTCRAPGRVRYASRDKGS